jgi:hypothetical protein
MAGNAEIELIGRKILEHVDRIIACTEGMDADGLNWKPAPETNSLWVLGTHMMGNVSQNILVILGGAPDTRDRDAEFAASGSSGDELRGRWAELRPQLERRLTELPAEVLEREYAHPRRGRMSGRELLINAATHAGEHVGHAELTRDLYRAK